MQRACLFRNDPDCAPSIPILLRMILNILPFFLVKLPFASG